MGRHEQREQVFILLFQVEFHAPEDMPRQLRLSLEGNETVKTREESDYIEDRCNQIRGRISEIDKLVGDNTEGWDTGRMGRVELAILRLAVFEMLYDDDIPSRVAIDEAVELAKKYGQENAGGFVNAILGKIWKAVQPADASG